VSRTPTLLLASLTAVGILACQAAWSYPEFQEFAEKNSGRTVNCAMCHISPNGPSGDQAGQIGGLDDKQMARLNQARAALQPGQEVDSPILNEFGNHIIKAIGKSKFLEYKKDPGQLIGALGTASDLDNDGIPDSTEFADGTDALDGHHGDPGKLFLINLLRYKLDLIMALISVATVVFGLVHLVKALNLKLAWKESSALSNGSPVSKDS
jgi:hypothetical protein